MGNGKSSNKVEMSNTPKNTKEKRKADKPVINARPLSSVVTPVVPVGIPAVVIEPATPAVVPVVDTAVPAFEPAVPVEEPNVTVIAVAEADSCNAAAKVAAGKMPVDLYYLPPSPPCRCVMLLAKVIGLDLNLKLTDITTGAHMTPEFLKLNPKHTIPVLEDNGLVLNESRAILGYLANQYSKNDSLYPKEPRARAIVDQRMYFDVGTLYQRCIDCYMTFIFHGTGNTPENLEKMKEAVGWFNTMLEGHNYAAGAHLTIADISLIVTISNLDAFGFDFASYPNVSAWFARTKQELASHGYEEINQTGANILGGLYKAKLQSS